MPSHPEITHAAGAVHNPRDPRHFMRIKPVEGRVRVRLGDYVLADSDAAVRVLEVGRDFYDPVVYLPEADVSAPLAQSAAASTHCPIKGNAVYFDLLDPDGGRVQEAIAWSYPEPVGDAAGLAGRIAFYGRYVTVEEMPD